MKNIEFMSAKLNDYRDEAERLMERRDSLNEKEQSRASELITLIENQQRAIETETKLQDEQMKNARAVDDGTVQATSADERSYRSLFNNGQAIRPDADFDRFGDFLKVVHSGRYDDRLEARQHNIAVGAEGGFAVPIEFAEFLTDSSLEDEIVRPRAKVYPMQHTEIRIPKWQTPDHSTGAIYGGLQGVWIDELAVNADQEGALEMVTLVKNKLAIFSSISNELVYDSPSFERELGTALRKGIGYFMDQAFLTGTGGNQPRGVLNDPALITVARDTAGSVVLDDVITMFSALYKGPGARPVWICNHDVIPHLMTLQDANGNYVWQPDARENVSGKLFGYPVLVSEKVPTAAAEGSIVLADLQHYAIGIGPDIYLEKNNAPGWTRDFTSYRAIVRVDGTGLWTAAMQTASGGALSWCVTLDA